MTDPFGNQETSGPAPQPSDRDRSPMTALRVDLFLLALFCALALGGTAFALVHEEREAIDDPVQKGQRGEVVGADGLSLLAPANLERALRVARAELKPDHQLTSLRLEPTRLDISVRDTIGEQRTIQVGLDYDARVDDDAGTSSSSGPRNLAGIDVNAPARALAAVIARERWTPRNLDYVVYDPPEGDTPSRWDLFFTKVPIERNHVAADGSGRLLEQ